MLENAFINKPEQPTDRELANALGPAKAAWDRLLSELTRELGVDIHEWKSHSPKWGWSLRVKRKARTVVWFSPSRSCFTALFILGGRAMQSARETRLPQRITNALTEAPKYPEGFGVRLTVKSSRDIAALVKLAAIKLAN